MPWAVASTVVGVAKLGAGLYGSSKAQKAAKKAARFEKKMTKEELGRLYRQNAKDEASVIARQNASGFSPTGGTQQAYMEEFKRLQGEVVEWLKLVGASRYNAQRDKADAIEYAGYAQAFSDIVGIGQSASNIDWKTGTP
jgi:hypothetical protein